MAIDKPASYSFHRAVKNAPKDVKSILADLQFLETILKEIKQNEEISDPSELVNNALKRCNDPVQAIHILALSLADGMKSRNVVKRKWAVIDSVWKKD
jgi:hypothetical protein